MARGCVPVHVSGASCARRRAVAHRRRRMHRAAARRPAEIRGACFRSRWVAAACLTIAINGSRDLPQYFVQAAPALALAAAWAGCLVFTRTLRSSSFIVAARRGDRGVARERFFKLVDNTWRDADYAPAACRGGPSRAIRRPGDAQVLGAGYGGTRRVHAIAQHAGRHPCMCLAFRPVPTYGGPPERVPLLLEPAGHRRIQRRQARLRRRGACSMICARNRPAIVALQQRDWYPDVDDSAHFFMATPGARSRGFAGPTHRRRDPKGSTCGCDGPTRNDATRAPICRGGCLSSRCSSLLAAGGDSARPLPCGRPSLEPDGRHRLARRRRVGSQRAQQGAVRGVVARQMEPGLHRARVHRARVRVVQAFGVGVRQARLVPEFCGLLSVWLLALGVARIAGRRAGLIAAALLATNYIYVMWNRAALMEGPMVAFMVAAWYCHARGAGPRHVGLRRRRLSPSAHSSRRPPRRSSSPRWRSMRCPAARRAGGGSDRGNACGVVDAGRARQRRRPRARDIRSATLDRLPVLQLADVGDAQAELRRSKSLVDRITWFPLQDVFTYMWFVTALGTAAGPRTARTVARALERASGCCCCGWDWARSS